MQNAAMGDFPTMVSSTRAANYYQGDTTIPASGDLWCDSTAAPEKLHRRIQQSAFGTMPEVAMAQLFPSKESMSNQRRIVQVIIADPDQNVPLESAILYKGDEKLTDLTDQELYFELGMGDLLKAHNAKRVTWTDKEASKTKGKDVFLEPIRIRDLRMVVVTVAQL